MHVRPITPEDAVIAPSTPSTGRRPTSPASRVLPLTDVAAADLLARSGLADLLDDSGAVAVVDLLLRVSLLGEEVPEIERLVLNPVIVSDGSAWVIDIDADVTPHPDLPPDDLRRLG